jgi:hypothetical protein
MLEDYSVNRETFFAMLFGKVSGIVCLAFLSSINRKDYREEFFEYPSQLPLMLDAINKGKVGYNVYFCPQLLSARKRVKENVLTTPCAWADLDRCPPDIIQVGPSVAVESSPGRYQAYWVFDKPIDPDDAEDISRRIAYKHADDGADRSGWDLTQLLRVPYTYNYKYGADPANIPMVTTIEANRNLYRISDFEIYPQAAGYQYLDVPIPDDVAEIDPDDLLQSYRRKINPLIWQLYTEEPEDDWSKPLWNLQMLLFETGMDRSQVFAVARAAKCNKYARDGRSEKLLWKEVCRAFAKNEANNNIFVPRDEDEPPLLTDAERDSLRGAKDGFVERYQHWARGVGDAAPQYHQAGAFMVLSALMCGSVRLPTSFGTLVPNLWFMILADTTLTRKTTAMDLAMDLVTELDPDIVMATDGSIEGLLSVLAIRPNKPSVFLRDEFSGLLEQMTKKDYMAGMPELLTKLYDGKMQKRLLRKETIEVQNPRLLIFAGGIKDKVTSLLTFEQVSSGFMPRFIFITAESDLTRVKPLGPPTNVDLTNRNAILDEMADLYKHYNASTTVHISKLNTDVEQSREWNAELTPDAWERYNLLESQMLQAGLASQRADVMTPTYDRLSKSILKAAVLLAASRTRNDIITVELEDMLRAILYGEEWKAFAKELIAQVGKGGNERQLDLILGAIVRQPGISRSTLMQRYHLTSRNTTEIFTTLEDRGLVVIQRQGKGQVLYPNERALSDVG